MIFSRMGSSARLACASALFQFFNTSKRSLVLDLGTDSGRASLVQLLDRSHACLFEEPASIAPLARNGKATPIEIAGFPVELDAATLPVSELAIQALGGLMHMIGEPTRKPLKHGGHQASYAAGLTAFTGLAAALAAREAGQRAPHVRVSLAEVMQWVNWKAASGAAATGASQLLAAWLVYWWLGPLWQPLSSLAFMMSSSHGRKSLSPRHCFSASSGSA